MDADSSSAGTPASSDELQKITESLYKQNLELAVKNKTLSLLERLYKISILSLDTKEIASRISVAIQSDFNFEHIGILKFDQETKDLKELAYAESKRFMEVRENATYAFPGEEGTFFKKIIVEKVMHHTDDLREVWGADCPPQMLAALDEEGHAHGMVGYPLLVDDAVIGICLIVMNQKYTELPPYESSALQSFSDVIAVALDKAMLYEQLSETNKELAVKNVRLQELDNLKTEFVSIASHQLRAPITAIKGYASLILEGSYGPVPPPLQEAADRIFQSSKSMATSVDDFLNIGRIEQGNMKYDIQEFNAGLTAKRTAEEFLPLAEKKGLALIFDAIPDGVVGYADENKSKQIMTNLIDNAIKYTPKGNVVISVTSDLAHKKILFSVKDSGIGLSSEDQKKLFTKFTRASNANTASVQGTGLGLYVAIQMAKAQGGTITVTSEGVGKGSTFTFEIPTK